MLCVCVCVCMCHVIITIHSFIFVHIMSALHALQRKWCNQDKHVVQVNWVLYDHTMISIVHMCRLLLALLVHSCIPLYSHTYQLNTMLYWWGLMRLKQVEVKKALPQNEQKMVRCTCKYIIYVCNRNYVCVYVWMYNTWH